MTERKRLASLNPLSPEFPSPGMQTSHVRLAETVNWLFDGAVREIRGCRLELLGGKL